MENRRREPWGDWIDRTAWFLLIELPLVLTLVYGTMRIGLCLTSTSYHGLTLKAFAEAVSESNYEIYGEFDRFGYKLFEETQKDRTRVYHNRGLSRVAELLGGGEVIVVHNHPVDVPFSKTDLCGAARDKPAAALVISTSNVYQLEAPNGWPDEYAVEAYLLQRCENNSQNALDSGLIKLEEQHDDGTFSYVTTDLLLEQFAGEFDLVYTVTPLEEWLEN